MGIYIVSFLILLHDLKESRWSLLKKFLIENKYFFYAGLIWFLVTAKAQIYAWDDFSWASFVKHVNHFDIYWNSESAILPQGMRYFPGVSLWEGFFLGKDLFRESVLFFSLGLIFIVGFHTLSHGNIQRKKLAWVLLLYIFGISCFCAGPATFSVDGAMGVVLALILCSAQDVKKPTEFLVSLIIAAFLAITKETGLCLALLPIFLIFLGLFKGKETFKKLSLIGVGLGLIGTNYFLWRNYLLKDPGIISFDSGSVVGNLSRDMHHLSQRSYDILLTLGEALFYRPISSSIITKLLHYSFLNFIGSYVFWVMLVVLVLIFLRDKIEFLMTFIVGLLGYTSILVVTYLYVFSDFEGRTLASYERYMGVYFLAFILFIIKLIFEKDLLSNKKISRIVIALILILPPSLSKAIPTSFLNPKRMQMREEALPLKQKIISNTPEDSRIWYIYLNSNGLHAMIFRYEIAPRKMNMVEWSIGEKYGDGDLWTSNYSREQFVARWKEYDYMALGNIDNKFTDRYGIFFTSPPKAGSLYKKTLINDQLKLAEVQ